MDSEELKGANVGFKTLNSGLWSGQKREQHGATRFPSEVAQKSWFVLYDIYK